MKLRYSCFLIFIFFILIPDIGFAQNKTISGSFEIKNLKDENQKIFYTKSILAADMENYRLKDKRVVLQFNNGFELEMLSAKEVFMKDNSFDPSSYPVDFPGRYLLPTFNILPGGQLEAIYHKMVKE